MKTIAPLLPLVLLLPFLATPFPPAAAQSLSGRPKYSYVSLINVPYLRRLGQQRTRGKRFFGLQENLRFGKRGLAKRFYGLGENLRFGKRNWYDGPIFGTGKRSRLRRMRRQAPVMMETLRFGKRAQLMGYDDCFYSALQCLLSRGSRRKR